MSNTEMDVAVDEQASPLICNKRWAESNREAAKYHREAARYHREAARYHDESAGYHETGNHAKATDSVEIAYEHNTRAIEYKKMLTNEA